METEHLKWICHVLNKLSHLGYQSLRLRAYILPLWYGVFRLVEKKKKVFECQNRVMVAVPGFLKCEIIVGSLLDPLSTALKCKLFYPTQFCNY